MQNPDSPFGSLGIRALFLVWGAPHGSHRSTFMAKQLGMDLRYICFTAKQGRFIAPFKYLAQTVMTLAFLIRHRYSLIFVQDPPICAVLPVYFYGLFSKSRFIIDSHTDALQASWWKWTLPLHRFLDRRAITTIVTNDELCQKIQKWGACGLTIEDPPAEFTITSPKILPADSLNAVLISTASYDEPIEELLKSALDLPNVNIYITGDFKRSLCYRGLTQNPPRNVQFTGYLPEDSYFSLLKAADVVLCLTTEDNTFLSGSMEALWLGKPLITSDWPVLGRYFNKGTILVDNSTEQLRQALILISRDLDVFRAEMQSLQEERRRDWWQKIDGLLGLIKKGLEIEDNLPTASRNFHYPQRICIVRQAPYPDDLMLRREAETLRDAGYDVSVITTFSRNAPRKEEIEGIRVYRLPPTPKKGGLIYYLYKYSLFFSLAAIKLTLEGVRKRFTFIQVNTLPDFLVFSTLIPRLMGAKITLFMYEPMPELWATIFHTRWIVKGIEIIQKLAANYAHAVFVVTEQQKTTLVVKGVDPNKVIVVLNTPDPRVWASIPKVGEKSKRHFTLICHGAIEDRYGHDTMLEAIHEVKKTIPHIRLRIMGVGAGRDRFLKQLKYLKLEPWVQYLGYVSLAELAGELHRADIGIVAQKESSYSHLIHTCKMFDFFYFGLPVISSRLKALEAYFNEGSLYFFEAGNPFSLGRAILDLYTHPEKRTLLIRNSQQLYQKYRWESQKDLYLSVYDFLLKKNLRR
jgi:glycosyltransferase involved in cell wall biosynthesis